MLLYRRLASPLHAARAPIAACWVLALVGAALIAEHPLVLAALALAVALAAVGAGVGRELVRPGRSALMVGLGIVTVNVLVTRQGLTVFARLGDLGPFGQGDLTVEALVYGIVAALKVGVAMLAFALGTLAVDSDRLLRALRRRSFRSALTASLATRMVGVLGGDAQRLAEAQRTRPAPPRGMRARAGLLAAIVGSSLDRAMDVAATLELRGLAASPARPRPPARARSGVFGHMRMATRSRARSRWEQSPSALSRHDLSFAAGAGAVLALALVTRLSRAGSFSAYPTLHADSGVGTLALCAALVAAVLAPFLDRRGIEP